MKRQREEEHPIMKKSVITPDFEQKESAPPISRSKRARLKEKKVRKRSYCESKTPVHFFHNFSAECTGQNQLVIRLLLKSAQRQEQKQEKKHAMTFFPHCFYA